MIVRLDIARASALLILIGAFIQANYLQIVGKVPLTAILLLISAGAMAASLPDMIRALERLRLDVVALAALALYLAVLGLWLTPDALSFAIEELMVTVLITAVLGLLAARSNARVAVVRWLPVIFASAAVVHFVAIFFGDFDVSVFSAGYTGGRYGFVGDRNIVNLTAANIGFTAMAAYVYGRLIARRRWQVASAAISVALLLMPLFATGSRSALLQMATTVVLVEGFKISGHLKAGRVLVASCLAGLVVAGLAVPFADVLPPAAQEIVDGALRRFDRMADDGSVGRFAALQAAMSSDAFFFGTFDLGGEAFYAARDNAFANYILTFGFFGLVLFTAVFAGALRAVSPRKGGYWQCLLLVALPVLIQAMSEGSFMIRSSVFCFAAYAAAAHLAFSATPARDAQRTRQIHFRRGTA